KVTHHGNQRADSEGDLRARRIPRRVRAVRRPAPVAAAVRVSRDGAAAVESVGLEERAAGRLPLTGQGRDALPGRRQANTARSAARESPRFVLRGGVWIAGTARVRRSTRRRGAMKRVNVVAFCLTASLLTACDGLRQAPA